MSEAAVQAKPASKRKSVARVLIVGAVVSGLLLFLALRSVPLHEVWQEISSVSLPILSLVLLAKFANLLLAALRSHVLIRNQHRFGLRVLFDCQLAGFSGNNVLPLRFGDLVRIDYMAHRGGLSHSACLQVVVIERLLDTLSLVTLCAALLPFVSAQFELGSAFYLASALTVAAALAIVVAGQRPQWFIGLFARAASLTGSRVKQLLVPKAEHFVQTLSTVSAGNNTLLAFALSLTIWCNAMLSVSIWFWAFDVSLPWHASFLVLLFLAFGMALPATPGQVGTYHYFVAAALTTCGLDKVQALSISVVGHAISVIPFTVIGLPSLISFALRRSSRRASSALAASEEAA